MPCTPCRVPLISLPGRVGIGGNYTLSVKTHTFAKVDTYFRAQIPRDRISRRQLTYCWRQLQLVYLPLN